MASYAEVAARNSDQTPAEASAPPPQTIIPNESLSTTDSISYTSGTSEAGSAPSGVHVIPASDVSEIDTSAPSSEPGPSISVRPVIVDETSSAEDTSNGGITEKLKGKKKFSKKDKEVAVYGGVGTLNLLALGAIGYWGWRRYKGGENGWKILGIAAGVWVGISTIEWASVRAFAVWKHKEKSS